MVGILATAPTPSERGLAQDRVKDAVPSLLVALPLRVNELFVSCSDIF
jgi:hypothetical protein